MNKADHLRWLNASPFSKFGQVFVGKTPLTGSEWDIDTLVKSIPNLTDVVDLTNSFKYYSGKDLPKSIKYHKFSLSGHELPSNDEIKNVVEFVKYLIKQDRTVFIHCTHGSNRSGLVSVLAMKELGMTDALSEFNRVRPPGIVKKDYSYLLTRPLRDGINL